MTVAAIVLAAGRGTRVGGPKVLLRTNDGETFVARIVRTAREAGISRILAVVASDRDDVRAAIPPGVDVVVNEAPERGPLSSLKIALGAIDDDAALVWPVDHPLVRGDTLRTLLAAATPGAIVVPRFGDRGGHPTIFPRATFPDLLATADDEGARAVVRRDPSRVVRVDVDDPAVVRDVDTKDDLASMRAAVATGIYDGTSERDREGLVALFDRAGSTCFCRWWHFEGDKNAWLARNAFEPETSRAELVEASRAGSDEGRGVIARAGDRVIGWMKVTAAGAVRKLYDQRYYRGLPMLGADRPGVFAIGCVLIDPEFRRRGVMTALATEAVRAARGWGATALEAFPRVPSEPVSDEEMWMGVERPLVEAGFRRVVDAVPYPVLRIDLTTR